MAAAYNTAVGGDKLLDCHVATLLAGGEDGGWVKGSRLVRMTEFFDFRFN